MGKSVDIREPEFDPVLGDIRHILDMGLEIQDETREPRTRSGWYASALGYCLRRQFLDRAEVPHTRPDTGGKRNLWHGRVMEKAMIARLRHAGILLFDNLHLVSADGSCSGYVDFAYGGHPVDPELEEGEVSEEWKAYLDEYRSRIAEAYPAGIPTTAVEFKTAAQYSAERQFVEGPMPHHKMQGAFYKSVTDEDPSQLPEGVESIDRFQIAVFAKNKAQMLVFPVLDVHVEQVRARLEELNSYWPETIPPCTCGKTIKWERDYCPYRSGETCCDQTLIINAPESYWDLTEPQEAAVGVEGGN